MGVLFKRSARVVVSTIELATDAEGGSLDVAFSVEKSLKSEPNTAEIQVWNLSPDHRSQLEEAEQVPVSIEAGYEGETALLFQGNLRTVFTVREGPDLITTLQSGDGEKEVKTKRINTSVGAGTSNDAVLKQVIKALGVGAGNSDEIVSGLSFKSNGQLWPSGTVLSGSAARNMTLLAESFGLEWSIQNGAIQLLQKGKALAQLDVAITSNTGLVGSPSVDNDGVLSCQTLLIPEIFPGRTITLESERLSGRYRVEQCTYTGDTAGTDWYIDLEAKAVG